MHSDSGSPFIKRFKINQRFYIYDVNTNHILEVDSPVYDIIGDYGLLTLDEIRQKYIPQYGAKCVEQALCEIENARKNENLFLSDKPQTLAFDISEDLQRYYGTAIESMTLEVTEYCNLRCHYCTCEYLRKGKRKRMSMQTAFDAIDFLYARSSSVKQRVLGFYGGEPLLEFELIKQCVNYARSKFGVDGIRFNITTNGTLIDEEKADYLAENRFNILVSIDGPKRIHNKHRVNKQGRGSYNSAIRGLRILLKKYHENAKDKVSINAVVTPPDDLNAIENLWHENPWLPADIRINVDFVSTKWTTFLQDYPCSEPQDTQRLENHMLSFKSNVLKGKPGASHVDSSLFENTLLRIYKRPFSPAPLKTYYPNGCCIPGLRKMFVKCDGNLYVCERAHGTPALGSLSAGFDYRVIRNIIDTYAQKSIRDCRSCWAVALCSLCYVRAYFNGFFSLEQKRIACTSVRKILEERMQLYCSILEQDKHALDYMESMEIG